MKIVFRARHLWPPASGDDVRVAGSPVFLLLQAAEPARAQALARAVADNGVEALIGRGNDSEVLYAPASPVFDDLLAIWLLTAGRRPPPEALDALCEYARLARLGHVPGNAPLQHTPAAILDQVRRGFDELGHEEQAQRLVRRSAELFEHLAGALERGARLTDADLFLGVTTFQEEIALLEADRALYLEDLRRGERSVASIRQGRVQRSVDTLVLDSPVSTRFADWARRDTGSASGAGYGLLLVRWPEGRWVLSADPTKRLDVGFVAQALQSAEDARRGGACDDPWYAGERHGGTVVASPRGGTRLDAAEVRAVVKRELGLKRVAKRRWPVPAVAAISLAILAALVGWWVATSQPSPRRSSHLKLQKFDDGSLPEGLRYVDRATGEELTGVLYRQVHAVIIGIDHYQDETLKLDYAVHDAKAVRDMLDAEFHVDRIHQLYDEEATRDRIYEVLAQLKDDLVYDDALFIFWAGHGTTVRSEQGAVGALVPHDGAMPDSSRNFSMIDIRSRVGELIPAKHKFMVVDACYAGELTRGAPTEPPQTDLDYLQEITGRRVFQILTAGGEDEKVLDGGPGGHSVFTGFLLEELRNADGYITAATLSPRLRQSVNLAARERMHRQLPLFRHVAGGEGDFVFFRKDFELESGD